MRKVGVVRVAAASPTARRLAETVLYAALFVPLGWTLAALANGRVSVFSAAAFAVGSAVVETNPWLSRNVSPPFPSPRQVLASSADVMFTRRGAERLAADRSVRVRCALASNPVCPPAVLSVLADDDDSHVRRSVAKNLNAAVSDLRAVASHDDYLGTEAVVQNPRCPVDILERGATCGDWAVRAAVAGSPRCPPPVLAALSQDRRLPVVANTAGNPYTPQAALETLASHPSAVVRAACAANPACPDHLRVFIALEC